MDKKNRLGIIYTVLGALIGIVGTILIFMTWYERALHFEAAEPGCEILLKYIMPALGDMAILAGVGFAVSAYGFYLKRNWAFPLAVISNVLALQASWFINVPFMAAGQPPVYFAIFWPYLVLYFLIMRGVGNISWGRTMLGMFTGLAFILCFMNGIASWSRIITIGSPIFALVQRLNWFSSIAWGVVTAGLLIRPKEWMRIVALGAGFLQIIVGTPIAIVTSLELGRFSLFSIAPITSIVIFIMFLSQARWERITGDQGKEAVA